MDEKLKLVIENYEREHKKFLALYTLGGKIENVGGNLLLFISLKAGSIGRFEKIMHVIFFFWCIVYSDSKTGGFKFGIILYIITHLCIMFFGTWSVKFSFNKLEKIKEECTNYFQNFLVEMYQKNGIIRNDVTKRDEVWFEEEDSLFVTSGMFCTDLVINIPQLYIEFTGKKSFTDSKSGLSSVKQNIASVEFTDKFEVLVPKGMELECMKYLTPSRQIEMLRTDVWDSLKNLSFRDGMMMGYMIEDFGSYTPYINVYSRKSIMKNFEEAENYCKKVNRLANSAYKSCIQLREIMKTEEFLYE